MCLGLGMAEDSPAAIVSPSMSGTFSVPLLLRKPVMLQGSLCSATKERSLNVHKTDVDRLIFRLSIMTEYLEKLGDVVCLIAV